VDNNQKIRIGIYNGFGVDPHCFTENQLWIENITCINRDIARYLNQKQ